MEDKLQEIRARWEDNLNEKCEACTHTMVRHFYRNMDQDCDTPDELYEALHHDRYDGPLLAKAGSDIKFLLDTVDEMSTGSKTWWNGASSDNAGR